MNHTIDSERPPKPARPRVLGIIALVAVVVGVGWAAWSWELRREAEKAAAKPPADPVSDAVIRHALESAGGPAGEVSEKTRWADVVPGIDLESLSPGSRDVFLRFANAERCTCMCGYTLAACRNYDAECETSLPRVQALYDSVRRGQIVSAEGLRQRPIGTP